MRERFLVIAAGGTGGHMFPAQALAEEMLRRGWRVALSSDDRGLRYAGRFPDAVERRLTRAATTARGGLIGKITAPIELLTGVRETMAWFRTDRPDAVAGFGGYPSAPAISAAKLLGIPRLIHEQNGVLGRVNALFARRVDALALGVEPVLNAPKGAPLVPIGNPIRSEARAFVGEPYAPPSGEGDIRILIVGGSQGASVFARSVPAAIAALPQELRARITITQQARPDDVDAVTAAYSEAGVRAEIAPFFDDLPTQMASAHLVISRAGASSVAEITALGRPSILAPYPHATADHQTANARALTYKGAAELMPDAAMTPEALGARLAELLSAPEKLVAMAAEAKALGRPDAAERLADLVEKIAG